MMNEVMRCTLCALLLSAISNLLLQKETYAQTWPNEPAGARVIGENSFDQLATGCWFVNGGSQTIVSDTTAPFSSANVMQMRYPIGMPNGISPGEEVCQFSGVNEFYFAYWWKPSNPWQGDPSNVNKMSFIFTAPGTSQGQMTTQMQGAPGGPYSIIMGLEYLVDNSHLGNGYGDAGATWLLWPNRTNAPVVLGTWYRVEVYMKRSSNSTSKDGILRWWVTSSGGSVIARGDYTNVNFPSGIALAQTFKIDPTWGGNGFCCKTQTDNFWYDHVRLSAPNGGAATGSEPPAAPTGLSVR